MLECELQHQWPPFGESSHHDQVWTREVGPLESCHLDIKNIICPSFFLNRRAIDDRMKELCIGFSMSIYPSRQFHEGGGVAINHDTCQVLGLHFASLFAQNTLL